MKTACFFLLWFPVLLFAQDAPVEVKIDRIVFSDTTSLRHYLHGKEIALTDTIRERKYTINYHITNKTAHIIRFYFNDDELENLAFTAYQEKDVVVANLATDYQRRNSLYFMGSPPEQQQPGKAIDPRAAFAQMLDASTFSMNPGQRLDFTAIIYWKKKQRNRTKNHQGYIDPGFPHFLTLGLNLMKDKYKGMLAAETFRRIKADPDFLQGNFVSDKFPIDFEK